MQRDFEIILKLKPIKRWALNQSGGHLPPTTDQFRATTTLSTMWQWYLPVNAKLASSGVWQERIHHKRGMTWGYKEHPATRTTITP